MSKANEADIAAVIQRFRLNGVSANSIVRSYTLRGTWSPPRNASRRFADQLATRLATRRRGQTCTAHRQDPGKGVYVGQVHREGIIDFLANLESRKGRNRCHERVHFFESLAEIFRDQRSNSAALSGSKPHSSQRSAHKCPA